jgi:hypothetical protein
MGVLKSNVRLLVKYSKVSEILTNLMNQCSSWDSESISASSKIPSLLWNSKIYHRISLLSQLSPVHAITL